MRTQFLCVVLAMMVMAIPGISTAGPISSTDLWDISQGSVVGSNSGALHYSSGYYSDIRDMFGGAFGTVEGGNTLLKDFMSPGYLGGSVPAGYTHYVEWHTPSAVTLRSFSLHAHNEGMDRRAFNHFTLYSGSGAGGPWTTIYDTGSGFTYGPGWLELTTNVSPVVAQYFRAEFVQAPWSSSTAVGPRIPELDGFNTFIPEPSTLALCSVLGLIGICFACCGRLRTA